MFSLGVLYSPQKVKWNSVTDRAQEVRKRQFFYQKPRKKGMSLSERIIFFKCTVSSAESGVEFRWGQGIQSRKKAVFLSKTEEEK